MRLAGAIFAALLMAEAVGATEIPQAERRSGYSFMTPDTQAMQDDDTSNPGMLWVLDGEALWKRKAGSANKACADCHTDGSMKGVAAHYPAFDKALGRPVNLEQRINLCRTNRQQASPLAYESRDLLALSAFVLNNRKACRLNPVPIRSSSRSSRGDASCSCNGKGSSISAAPIAMTTTGTSGWRDRRSRRRTRPGYPLYRLEWQSLGSLQRRLRACMSGVRAQAYDYGAPELVELELYLMSRARGMPMEAPAVRP